MFRIAFRSVLVAVALAFAMQTTVARADPVIKHIRWHMPNRPVITAKISRAGGAQSIALFNNQPGQVPAPISSTSYKFPGSGVVTHTLMGVVPGALYSVVLTDGVVHVDQSPAGNKTASPAGVLHFTTSSSPSRRRAVRC
jgi:hypothetical protein